MHERSMGQRLGPRVRGDERVERLVPSPVSFTGCKDEERGLKMEARDMVGRVVVEWRQFKKPTRRKP
jgi:hypothetical protein